jgi:alkylation response protein AidB-like acyl-CoA dehydrogenase
MNWETHPLSDPPRRITVKSMTLHLRVHQILEGTNEIMRLIVARSLFEDVR